MRKKNVCPLGWTTGTKTYISTSTHEIIKMWTWQCTSLRTATLCKTPDVHSLVLDVNPGVTFQCFVWYNLKKQNKTKHKNISLIICFCVLRGRRGGRGRWGGGEGSEPSQTHNLVGCWVLSERNSLAALEAWQSQGPNRRGLRGSRQTGTHLKCLCLCIFGGHLQYAYMKTLYIDHFDLFISPSVGVIWWHWPFPHFTVFTRAPALSSSPFLGVPGVACRVFALCCPLLDWPAIGEPFFSHSG